MPGSVLSGVLPGDFCLIFFEATAISAQLSSSGVRVGVVLGVGEGQRSRRGSALGFWLLVRWGEAASQTCPMGLAVS